MCNLPKIPTSQIRLEQRILASRQWVSLFGNNCTKQGLLSAQKGGERGHLEKKEKILSPARSRTWIPGFKVPCANRYTTGDSCWPLTTMTFVDNSVPETATIGARRNRMSQPYRTGGSLLPTVGDTASGTANTASVGGLIGAGATQSKPSSGGSLFGSISSGTGGSLFGGGGAGGSAGLGQSAATGGAAGTGAPGGSLFGAAANAGTAGQKPAAGGGSSLGGTGGLLGQKSGGLSSTGAKGAEPDPNLEQFLEGKTVKQILDYFDSEHAKQVEEFRTRKQRVNRTQKSIFRCLALMRHLDTQIKAVKSEIGRVNKRAKDLLPEETQTTPAEKGTTSAPSEQETSKGSYKKRRDETLYELAERLGRDLQKLNDDFAKIQPEPKKGEALQEEQTDAEKLMKLANYHLASLRWMDQMVLELEERIAKLRTDLL